jgi:tripartite-type tricarboxylate transporter receptor subunit TctC
MIFSTPVYGGDAMAFPRRQFLHGAAASLGLSALPRLACAQLYPSRPITLVVPFPAGGPVDTLARFPAERMRASLGQPLVIENISGAGGSIGVGRVARASPDGYTLIIGITSTHVFNGAMYSLQYDVLNDREHARVYPNARSDAAAASKTNACVVVESGERRR